MANPQAQAASVQHTFYALGLVGIIIATMVLAQSFLIPVFVAGLLAMLLYPVASRLERWGWNRILVNVICLLIVLVVLGGLISLLTGQILLFADDLPMLQQRLDGRIAELQGWIATTFGISNTEQLEMFRKQTSNLLNSSGQYLSGIANAASGAVASFSLILIYIFFMLLYRERLRDFVLKLVNREQHTMAKHVIHQIQSLTQSYMTGVLIVIAVLATLNSIGLLVMDVQPAIFLGLLAALLNIIPYIGVLIGSIIPISIAFLTKDGITTPLIVMGIFVFNQFLENNFLTPNIVGSKISVNPFATIMALIIGNLVWGVVGMILFIPLLGVVKVIFDNVESLHPYGYLIGEDTKEEKAAHRLQARQPKTS